MWESHSVFFSPTSSLPNLWKHIMNKRLIFCTCKSLIPFSTVLFFISWNASLLSQTGGTFTSDPLISIAACFACWSTNSFPSISLWPRTQCTLISFCRSLILLKLVFMSRIISILFLGNSFPKAVLIADWQSVRICIFFWFTVSVSAKYSKPICIPTSSPV